MMNGSYKFILDGSIVAESKNIITNTGKTAIRKYLGGVISDWAGAMSVGIGKIATNTTATAASGATTITVASATGIVANQPISGNGIQSGTAVGPGYVSGTSVPITLATTTSLSNTPVTFYALPALTDTTLGFEVDRQPTILRTLDSSGNVILKASFPTDLSMTIKEVGLYPFLNTTASGLYGDSFITDFSEGVTTTSDIYWSGTNASVDTDSLRSLTGNGNIQIVGTTSSSTNYARLLSYGGTGNALSIDASGYSTTDQFQIAYYNMDATLKTITLELSYDNGVTFPTSYTIVSASTAAAGYYIASIPITSVISSPITSIQLRVNSSGGTVSFDALKFLNTDETDYIPGIVSRSALSSPIIKQAGQSLEVEYSLAVS